MIKKAIYKTHSAEETMQLGFNLAKSHICAGDVVLLYGDLGMGKTHFAKGLAQGLGIEGRVKSPTYVYVKSYPLNDISEQLFHYDLYRLEGSAELIGSSLESIGFLDSIDRAGAINLVEWSDRIPDSVLDQIQNKIIIRFSGEGTERQISIEFFRSSILPESEIESYYNEWGTPMHVRNHCRQVTNVAMQIAEAYVQCGQIVNLELLYPACMLHDMNRICDFKTLDRNQFFEPVTDEKWNKWLDLRERFKGQKHEKIAYKILSDRGFLETANVIRLHSSKSWAFDSQAFDSLEKKLLCYADKRVKHDQIVSLKERFRDGRERYGKNHSKEQMDLSFEVEKRIGSLESQLFCSIDLNPNQIGF